MRLTLKRYCREKRSEERHIHTKKMTRFTIVLAVLVALTNIQPNIANPYFEEEDPSKEPLLYTILNAKNRAYDQVQNILMVKANNMKIFTGFVKDREEKAWFEMEILKKEFTNVNTATCDKAAKAEIKNNAEKTIDHYENCVSKVSNNAEWDMQSMSSDASVLTKDILAAKNIDEELRQRTAEFEARSFQFFQYMHKLGKCDTQSNLPRLQRQISETLTSYKQCLKKL